jgi:hypothetical protein
MHKNHRRTIKQDHNASQARRGRWLRRRSWAWEKRAYWQKQRAQQAVLMHHGKHDSVRTRHPKSIAWDYW